jgi:hypothetical protein
MNQEMKQKVLDEAASQIFVECFPKLQEDEVQLKEDVTLFKEAITLQIIDRCGSVEAAIIDLKVQDWESIMAGVPPRSRFYGNRALVKHLSQRLDFWVEEGIFWRRMSACDIPDRLEERLIDFSIVLHRQPK